MLVEINNDKFEKMIRDYAVIKAYISKNNANLVSMSTTVFTMSSLKTEVFENILDAIDGENPYQSYLDYMLQESMMNIKLNTNSFRVYLDSDSKNVHISEMMDGYDNVIEFISNILKSNNIKIPWSLDYIMPDRLWKENSFYKELDSEDGYTFEIKVVLLGGIL